MKVGDLVRASWSNNLTHYSRGKNPLVGVYLGRRRSDSEDIGLSLGSRPAFLVDVYHIILSDSGAVELPSWHWDVEEINESR